MHENDKCCNMHSRPVVGDVTFKETHTFRVNTYECVWHHSFHKFGGNKNIIKKTFETRFQKLAFSGPENTIVV